MVLRLNAQGEHLIMLASWVTLLQRGGAVSYPINHLEPARMGSF